MTTFSFTPTSSSKDNYAWDDPTIWNPAVVPNSPDADVIIPTVTKSDGSIFFSRLGFDFKSFTVHSLSLANNTLGIDGGPLSVGGSGAVPAGGLLQLISGGRLTAASLNNSGRLIGNGQATIAGTLTNSGTIMGVGLTVTTQQLVNIGTIEGFIG